MALKRYSFRKLRKEKSKIEKLDYEYKIEKTIELEKEFYSVKDRTTKGKLRISLGDRKNYLIDIPVKARPLTSYITNQIFNVLGPDIKDKYILDLYAGSGLFGFTALSLGGRECTLVDASKEAYKVININAKRLAYIDRVEVVQAKSIPFLQDRLETEIRYDLIFIDPPFRIFEQRDKKHILELLRLAVQIKNETEEFPGAIILKYPTKKSDFVERILKELGSLNIIDTRSTNTNSVSIMIGDPR